MFFLLPIGRQFWLQFTLCHVRTSKQINKTFLSINYHPVLQYYTNRSNGKGILLLLPLPLPLPLLLLLLLLLLWRYSPGWALASITTRLQISRSLAPSPFVYSHLSQVRRHIIQPSRFWSSSASCCIQLSVHLFGDCCVLHSFYVT
jgi:hypothetical protein